MGMFGRAQILPLNDNRLWIPRVNEKHSVSVITGLTPCSVVESLQVGGLPYLRVILLFIYFPMLFNYLLIVFLDRTLLLLLTRNSPPLFQPCLSLKLGSRYPIGNYPFCKYSMYAEIGADFIYIFQQVILFTLELNQVLFFFLLFLWFQGVREVGHSI